jgi:hypothetical protein
VGCPHEKLVAFAALSRRTPKADIQQTLVLAFHRIR